MTERDSSTLTLEELETLMEKYHQPKYRAKQIHQWLVKGIREPAQMTNIPENIKQILSDFAVSKSLTMINRSESQIDGTIKYLWKLSDGNCIESVLMRYKYGNTVCVSTQSGCKMGCAFCASTGIRFDRNLTAGEIHDQIVKTSLDIHERISHIVLMGIGEPLDNFENVISFIKMANDPEGLNISMRHISLSTCGIPNGINRLAEEKIPITLSVSLHAPNDEIRSRIMPVNRIEGIQKLIADCRSYFKRTGRRISFEYAMIKDVNDSVDSAHELADLLKGLSCHVNLIPLNYVNGSPLLPSGREQIEKFQSILNGKHIPTTIRRKLGDDILAACGQLRRSVVSKES